MEFLTLSDAAEFLPFGESNLYRLARLGELQRQGLPFKKLGQKWFITKDALARWHHDTYGEVPPQLEDWSRKSAAA